MIRKKTQKIEKPPHGGDVWSKPVNIDFSSNVNPLGPPERVKEALTRAIEEIRHYPDINASKLKEAISGYVGTPPENITPGNGSTELIKNFCEVFVGAGNVVIPAPTFSEYEYFARLYGASVQSVPLDTKKIIDAIDKDADAVFLCNPNNPTGTIFDEDEILDVLNAANDASAFVFLDEAYIEFSDGKSFVSRVQEFENLFVSRSLTKFFSLAGLRVGYGVANKGLIDCMEKVRIPWNVNTLAQMAGIESLKDKKFIETSKEFIKKERDFLFNELSKFLKVEKTHANFFLIDLDGKIKSSQLKEALLEKGMLIRDCSTFTGLDDNFIRVCIRKHDENARLIEELGKEL
jgi:threonine-phosphate decarboxylase